MRLDGYDYTLPGAYFVTMCTHDHKDLFGEIQNSEVHLNEFGKIVYAAWLDLPNHYPLVELDCHVIISNHFHGIIYLNEHHNGHSSVGAGLRPTRTIHKVIPAEVSEC